MFLLLCLLLRLLLLLLMLLLLRLPVLLLLSMLALLPLLLFLLLPGCEKTHTLFYAAELAIYPTHLPSAAEVVETVEFPQNRRCT